MTQYSIADARNKFTSVVREVEQRGTVELTRRGKPVAVMLSIEEYEKLTLPPADFWASYLNFRETYPGIPAHGIPADGIPGDDATYTEFLPERDRSPGRDVPL